MKKIRFLLLLAVFCSLALPKAKVYSAAPSPYDLIAAVNNLRAGLGLSPLEIDGSLMAAAQNQSDYLGSNYGTNSPTWDQGHIGAGGTYARDRAVAAGYPLAAGMNVVENWAGGNNSTPLSDIIYSYWSDSTHMNTMTTADGVAVGAGITEGDGYVYYILDVAVKYGSGGSSGGGVPSTIPTTAVTAQVALVQVATPNADGKIIHTVKLGQALWSISAAYDIPVDQLIAMNGLSKNAVIFEGQELLIQAAYTPTPSPTATLTPRPPTRTPIPQQTAQPVATVQEQGKGNGDAKSILNMDRKTMGLALILICGIGLALMIIGTASKDKKPPKQDL
ncbi:MAG: LysM peptidoglycan-binding domain-containing protein [Pelolinea sp.]|nr:LysM peptidoglycan-binding domain-containing protein [Pelolinea sp.]